ncbi:MAG TPA: quinolinate synthase NadA [Xanthobacteraceae bacterium]|jgi:quinolinate synthase|nr:quinolinate synthase NadA [Xanthobacteraceae bacterium]
MLTETFKPDLLARVAPLYARVKAVVPPIEWPFFARDIEAILDLKRARNAVILAHNYQTPEIFHCVADIVGDSLALAREATRVDADVIVLAGVHFMAETAKLLNPAKTVLIPDTAAGCSLASSITPADVRLLRQRYPGVPIVSYVNTSAAVKAESDICCTSGNAKKVVESLGVDQVIMLPDQYLAQNVAAETGVEIIAWAGHCEVHERFTAAEISLLREQYPGVIVLAHPECPPEVVAEADFAGSTAAMIEYVGTEKPARVVLVTECSMSDNVAVDHPDIEFVRPCNLCPHMKRITLPKIRQALETLTYEITIDPAVAAGARRAVERMLAI